MGIHENNGVDPDSPESAPFEPHPDQLRPKTVPGYDHVMHGPPGTDVASVFVRIAEDDAGFRVTSVPYGMDERQRAMVEAGGYLVMNLWQHPMPPVSLIVEGPSCQCHGDEMAFNDDERGFYCAHQATIGEESDDGTANEDRVRRDFSPAPDDEGDVDGGRNGGPGPAEA